ncbi:MAG: HNH endonuclease [Bacteroidaceae bacterium]|nr:HNH endonuclease [Bacteroidaceae bacterium]
MTQQGFEDYLFAVFGYKNGTAKSYITAIHIIDELFTKEDKFGLKGLSIVQIKDYDLLTKINEFIREEQLLFKNCQDSFFRNISSTQSSYPGKGFCSAAMKQLLRYYAYNQKEEQAWSLVKERLQGKKVSEKLESLFDIDREGRETAVMTRVRLGQNYFRKMVLQNYGNKCCVTGLNVPQILRASHIVSWASDKTNRMNPENGLCLSATYDAAFDQHLISFDEDYRMIVSKQIKDYFTNQITKQYFEDFEGKRIILPSLYMPSKKLLEKHRNFIVG